MVVLYLQAVGTKEWREVSLIELLFPVLIKNLFIYFLYDKLVSFVHELHHILNLYGSTGMHIIQSSVTREGVRVPAAADVLQSGLVMRHASARPHVPLQTFVIGSERLTQNPKSVN